MRHEEGYRARAVQRGLLLGVAGAVLISAVFFIVEGYRLAVPLVANGFLCGVAIALGGPAWRRRLWKARTLSGGLTGVIWVVTWTTIGATGLTVVALTLLLIIWWVGLAALIVPPRRVGRWEQVTRSRQHPRDTD